MRVESGWRSEDGTSVLPGLGSFIVIGDEEWISRPGRVVCESGALARPVALGNALKEWPRLAAECGHSPDADVFARSVLLARPIRDQRAVGREPQRADRRINQLRRAAASQVVELSRTDLRNPDIHLSVAVGQKGD